MATTILSFSSKSAGGRRPCLDRRASNHRLQPHDEGGTRNSNLTIHSEDTYMNDYFNLRFRIAFFFNAPKCREPLKAIVQKLIAC